MSILIFSFLSYVNCLQHDAVCRIQHSSYVVLISTDCVTLGGPTLVLAFFGRGAFLSRDFRLAVCRLHFFGSVCPCC